MIGAVLFGVRKAAHTFFGGEEMHASKNASLPQHLWAIYGALISQRESLASCARTPTCMVFPEASPSLAKPMSSGVFQHTRG